MKMTFEEYKNKLEEIRADRSLGWKEEKEKKDALYTEWIQGVEVGDGVTLNLYSDSHACTVIKRTAKTLTVQRDNAKRIDNNGMSDSQEYEYTPNENGNIEVVRWSNKYNCWMWCDKAISMGRHEYYDYSF